MSKKTKLVRHLLSWLLLLLGFSACEVKEEYGSPTVDYQVKGKVTTASGEVLKGIQVVVKDQYGSFKQADQWGYGQNDTIYTDANGEFVSHEARGSSLSDQKVYFYDVDGELNGGTFKPDSIGLKEMTQTRIKKGDGNWYGGKYELGCEVKLNKEK